MASVALAVVAGGAVYGQYAERLFESARALFWPLPDREFVLIKGEEGWPNGTMRRPAHLLSHLPTTDFVYLCDADMLVEGLIGPEILPPTGAGLAATLHPGFVGRPAAELPHEARPGSACFVPPERRERYFCGGFWGGSRVFVQHMAGAMIDRIDRDVANGIVPTWHDESALNAAIDAWGGPDVALSPAYCHPDRDEWYRGWWPEDYPRLLVALDKPESERGGR